MDIKINCKGHCEKLSHFLDRLSHTEISGSRKFNQVLMKNKLLCPGHHYFSFVKLWGNFLRSWASYSKTINTTRHKFKYIRDFMFVMDTCKFKKFKS